MVEPGMAKPVESVANDAPPLRLRFKKGPWTPAEDTLLLAYIQSYGEGNWNAVQKHVGLCRAGKSCRLRWTNHLRPNLKKGSFTPQEELMIIHLQAHLGNKWALMAQKLRGRTDNEIKNFWNTRKKRLLRAGKPLYPSGISTTMQINSAMQEDITNLRGRIDNEIKNLWNTRKKRLLQAGKPLYSSSISTTMQINSAMQEGIPNVGNDSFICPPLQPELPNSNIDQSGNTFLESSDGNVLMQQLPYLESLDADINANIAICPSFKSASLLEPPSYQIEVPSSPMELPSYQIEVPMPSMEPPSYQIEVPMSPLEPPSYQIEVPNGTLGSPISNCFWQLHLPCNVKSPKMPCYASTSVFPLQTIFPRNTFTVEEGSMQMPNSDNLLEAFLLQQIQGGGRDQISSNGLETLEQVVPPTNKYLHMSSDPLSLLGGQALLLLNEDTNPSSHLDFVVPSTTTCLSPGYIYEEALVPDCKVNHFEGSNAWT